MVDTGNSYRDKVSQLISWGHWFTFFNIIAVMLIGTRYVYSSGWPETPLAQTYQLLTWIGHFGFLVFALYIVILFPISFAIPSQRLMRLFAVIVSTLGITLLIVDIYAFETLHLHLNLLVWELLISGENTQINAHWQTLFIVVPAIFFLEVAIAEWIWRSLRRLSRKRVGVPIALAFSLCFVGSHLIHIWADAFFYSPVTSQRSNFPLSYPMTAKTFMEKHGFLDRQEYQKRRAEIRKRQNSDDILYPLEKLTFNNNASGAEPKQNLLFIMVDGLRADMLNPIVMPGMDSFADKNLRFNKHYSSSNDTMAGIFGLFYGLPGNYAKSIRAEGLQPELLMTLKKEGYDIGLFSSNNLDNPIYYQSVFSDSLKNMPTVNQPNVSLADKKAVELLTDWVENHDKTPWFSFLQLSSVDEYEKGGDYKKPFRPALEDHQGSVANHSPILLKNSYNNAAHYADGLVSELMATLSSKGILDNTIVVFTSDHGVEFNETGSNSWGANTNYSRFQLQVPMVIHWPGQAHAAQNDYSSHLDIVPTLMESMLGVSSPSYLYASGRNLFELTNTPRKWIIAGDSRDIAVVQRGNTTIVDKFGNYHVYDSNYKLQPDGKPQISVLMQVMHELKRFYPNHQREQN
ncbi:DUF3413 domain-containing protein [Veronia pacifica]|uniref:Hydrolase n=1 Tax=Veronia pacifica TaxID=1080227 RepID=A0A1C3EJT9_9GAMM|nr:DUF3413 domain-containing protein [Veronia pacifica]ODA33502.1 hydrolase [Veronia pacifica]